MNEFLKGISTSELINLAAQAERGNFEASEALIRHEIERRNKLAGFALSNGVYDADDGTPDSPDHPGDDRWWPNIELGRD